MTASKLAKMTQWEKRTAIALLAGWTDLVDKGNNGPVYGLKPGDVNVRWMIPDYLNSLDAMAEAEKALSTEQGMQYRYRLSCNSDGPKAAYLTVEAAMCHASASERVDAFLLTIG